MLQNIWQLFNDNHKPQLPKLSQKSVRVLPLIKAFERFTTSTNPHLSFLEIFIDHWVYCIVFGHIEDYKTVNTQNVLKNDLPGQSWDERVGNNEAFFK